MSENGYDLDRIEWGNINFLHIFTINRIQLLITIIIFDIKNACFYNFNFLELYIIIHNRTYKTLHNTSIFMQIK